jgi:polyisoprenyl-teichoic acid--peptidoglycan teichoic acid transferase
MSTPQRSPRAPRTRSAFGAAFLSLLFPGLGHAYAGAWGRALGFAALPLLAIASIAGLAVGSDKFKLIAAFASPTVLNGVLVVNVLAFLYRAAAAADAWNVARFLNARAAAGDGRLGRSRMPLNPLSIAGLIAVVAVMGGAHLAVWRYDALALSAVNCLNPDTADDSCDSTDPGPSNSPSDSGGGDLPSDIPSGAIATDTPLPTPEGSVNPSATPPPSLPPWDGTSRLNILLVGTDQRSANQASFNTDTMIVVSIDPKTKQVAMLQLPRDSWGVPVPPSAQGVWGSIYGGRVNSWFAANQNRKDLWPGKTAQARGFAALKAMLGNLYGLNIQYYVKVDFQGFKDAVDVMGGVTINVQIPVAEDDFPLTDKIKTRVYIPAGPQEMNGTTALVYARSRHTSTDFDRGFRQQRVVLSFKNQLDPQSVFANLTGLVGALKKAVKTDIPVADTTTMGQLLDLASKVDTKGIRSYVFAPPYFATDMYGLSGGTDGRVIVNAQRIEQAAKQAFSLPSSLISLRNSLSGEGAQVWIEDGKNGMGLAGNHALYLSYFGVDASAPVKLAPVTPQTTTITVYNGADAKVAATVKYLAHLYGATAVSVTDPKITADIVVVVGRNAHKYAIPNAG